MLVREHPKAAFGMLSAGVVQAGRTGFGEIKGKLFPKAANHGGGDLPPELVDTARRQLADKLGEREMGRIKKMLAEDSESSNQDGQPDNPANKAR